MCLNLIAAIVNLIIICLNRWLNMKINYLLAKKRVNYLYIKKIHISYIYSQKSFHILIKAQI